MKKGLRSVFASVALSGMSLLASPKMARAEYHPESVIPKEQITELGKTLAANDGYALYGDIAEAMLGYRMTLSDMLKTPLDLGKPYTHLIDEGERIKNDKGMEKLMGGMGEHLSSWGKKNLKQRLENIKKFLVIDENGRTKVDFSRCKSVVIGYGEGDEALYVALNYPQPNTSSEEGVLLRVNEDHSLSVTDEDDGTALLEICSGHLVINPTKETFRLEKDNFKSPEMSYGAQKGKTLTPTTKKAVIEKKSMIKR